MNRILLSTMAGALLLLPAAFTAAKDAAPAAEAPGMKQVAVISLSGYDKIINDVSFIGTLAGKPGLDKQLEGMLAFMTQGQGVNGLDKARPWGVVLNTDGMMFQPLAFLPVQSLKQLLTSLGPLVGDAQDAGNGLMELEKNNQKLYLKEQNGWAFIGQSPDAFEDLPKDPTKWLAGLEKKYEIAVRLNVPNIPEMYRTLALDQLKASVERGTEKQPDEDDSDFELRQQLTQNQLKSFEELINDTDQLTIGWALDHETKSTYLDFNLTALPGSDLAKKVAQYQETTSAFAGFAPDKPAASVSLASKVNKEDADQIVATLSAVSLNAQKEIDKSNDLPDDASKATAKEIVSDVINALKATVQSGKVDAAAGLALGDKTLTLAAGGYIAEPAKIEKAFKKLAELGGKDPKFPAVKFDAAKHAGVRFHAMSVPIADEKAAKVLGEKLDIVVGFGPKAVYVGVGKDGLSAAKKAIDKSAASTTKKVMPFQADVALAPVLQFVAATDDNPMTGMLADQVSQPEGKDHVTLVASSTKNGVNYRLQLQEGVLKLIGAATAQRTGGGQAGGPPGGVQAAPRAVPVRPKPVAPAR